MRVGRIVDYAALVGPERREGKRALHIDALAT